MWHFYLFIILRNGGEFGLESGYGHLSLDQPVLQPLDLPFQFFYLTSGSPGGWYPYEGPINPSSCLKEGLLHWFKGRTCQEPYFI